VCSEPDPDRVLAEVGAELADRLAAVVPGWVVSCVVTVFDAWCAAGAGSGEASGPVPGPGHEPAVAVARRDAVAAEAEATGKRAGEVIGAQLRALLSSDVDTQRSTPLEAVRAAVTYPTGVLRAAGVAPVERDRFTTERFPDDVYGLTPASLAAVDPSLGELSVRWGAAKAAAHRRRHR
jgi:hypothetical protein